MHRKEKNKAERSPLSGKKNHLCQEKPTVQQKPEFG
jgi:hypothetical protein